MLDKKLMKLEKLCEHWANHNISHKENFEKWKNIATELGYDSVAKNLEDAMVMMDKCNDFLIKAKNELK
jgi:nickel/cobalt transporter (NicO) family protein